MTTFNLSWLLTVILLTATPPAQAQQPGKIFRIGYLDATSASGMAVLPDAFRQEMGKLGWIEGKNFAIEYRFAEQKRERIAELAEDLVRQKVDLIIASEPGPAIAVKKLTAATPVVIVNNPDPVRLGLVASLARPGGNVTGVTSFGPELGTKRLEILKDALPKLSRAAVLWTKGGSAATVEQVKMLRPVAEALRLKLEEIDTESDFKGLETAFQTAKQKQVGGIMTVISRGFFAERKQIVALASRHRLPAIHFQKEFVDDGGLMSYGADYADLYRKVAYYVDKILKGAKPADLPVQQATKFEFVINLKAAKQIGLTLSPEF